MCIRDRYQAVLDGDGDIVSVAKWIADTERRKHTAQARLTSHSSNGDLNAGEIKPVSYTHLRAHETVLDLVCRLLLEKKNTSVVTLNNIS